MDCEVVDGRLDGVRLLIRREDLRHPDMPGNKWRKLKYNLAAAAEQGHEALLTFGGAYSNHLRATAAAGRLQGFRTIGVVRGEEHLPLNESLSACVRDGMTLTYLDRSSYRRKNEPDVIAALQAAWGRFYLVPEGGSNALAVRGCAELGAEIGPDVDVVCCPVGTGGTLAGIAAGLRRDQRALGFAVLKTPSGPALPATSSGSLSVDPDRPAVVPSYRSQAGPRSGERAARAGDDFLSGEVRRLQGEFGRVTGNWAVELGYHFGGYAKCTPELEAFTTDFEQRHGIAIDRVYVAKMLAGIYDLTAAGRFPAGTTILAVKTG